MTNGEKLKNMDLEEMAAFLDDNFLITEEMGDLYCRQCQAINKSCICEDSGSCKVDSIDVIRNFLKKE